MELVARKGMTRLKENTDIIGLAVNTVVVGTFAFFAGATRCLMANEYDISLIVQAFEAPEWINTLGWIGQAAVLISVCYLGLELGLSAVECLARRGLVTAPKRPAVMTALQWVSSVGMALAFSAHFIVFVVCRGGYKQYPLAGGEDLSDLALLATVFAVIFAVSIALMCVVFRLHPQGQRFSRMRRASAALKLHPVARWMFMCLVFSLFPILATCILTVVILAGMFIISFIVALAMMAIIMPLFMLIYRCYM